MISEQECMKILNSGEVKFSAEQVKQIRDLLTTLALIEYEQYKKQNNKAA